MPAPKQFLIIDPYLLIYPEADAPLDRKLALQFIRNLSIWAKLMDNPAIEIGLSQECTDIIKQHPRSILNKKFLREISEFTSYMISDIQQVIVPMISKIKRELAYTQAINSIDEELVIYEIESTFIAPAEFQTRLPEHLQYEFSQMLGHLTFARAQQFVPLAIFEQIQFLTVYHHGQPDWLLPNLMTSVHINYDSDVVADHDPLQNPIMDEFEIVDDPASLITSMQATTRRTLRDVVEDVTNKHPDVILVSKELQDALKKQNDILSNADNIERAIEALRFWLRTFKNQRELHYGESEAFEIARQTYKRLVSHDMSDESTTVKRKPELRNERLVRYQGAEYHAYWHIKTSPRIHFAVIQHEGNYSVLLGKIVNHLSTARYSI